MTTEENLPQVEALSVILKDCQKDGGVYEVPASTVIPESAQHLTQYVKVRAGKDYVSLSATLKPGELVDSIANAYAEYAHGINTYTPSFTFMLNRWLHKPCCTDGVARIRINSTDVHRDAQANGVEVYVRVNNDDNLNPELLNNYLDVSWLLWDMATDVITHVVEAFPVRSRTNPINEAAKDYKKLHADVGAFAADIAMDNLGYKFYQSAQAKGVTVGEEKVSQELTETFADIATEVLNWIPLDVWESQKYETAQDLLDIAERIAQGIVCHINVPGCGEAKPKPIMGEYSLGEDMIKRLGQITFSVNTDSAITTSGWLYAPVE